MRVEVHRGALAESVHQVHAAVVDREGRLLASNGDPDRLTYWRSAAKPFQILPLLQDGAAARFGLTDEELALACASHSSEPFHLDLVSRFLAKVGLSEDDLACGPHEPLSAVIAKEVLERRLVMTPRWSNCSGKHTAMLALAKHHGWPLVGYQLAGHPLQDRLRAEVERWTGLRREEIVLAVDGCTTVCFGLPLRAMALSYARFGIDQGAHPRRLWGAMTSHPHLVAGTKRLCTDLMRVWPGEIVAKIGAEGVYCAAIPSLGVGIALKVEDGEFRAVGVALTEIIRQVVERLAPASPALGALVRLDLEHRSPAIHTTRGELSGRIQPAGTLAFS
jgi:L-asparaginase II